MSEPQDYCAYIVNLEARIKALEVGAGGAAPKIAYGVVGQNTYSVSTGFDPNQVVAIQAAADPPGGDPKLTSLRCQITKGGFNILDNVSRLAFYIATAATSTPQKKQKLKKNKK